MREPVYRSEQVVIRLVNRGSTFAARLRMALKAARLTFLVFIAVCLAVGFVLLGGVGVMIWQAPSYDPADVRELLVEGAATLLATIGVVMVTMLAIAAVKSASPDPAEQLLPRELHLFEDHVMVFPSSGAAFHAPWNAYVVRAKAAPRGITLLLGREPHLEFFVRRGALAPHEWLLLQRWLEVQRLL